MKKVIWFLVAIGSLVLPSFRTRADILMIDLNANSAEVEAARRAAAQRGERLILLPTVDAATQTQIAQANLQYESAQRVVNQMCFGATSNTARCDSATDAALNAQRRLTALREPLNLNGQVLSQALARIRAQNINLSSVVISGHDGNGHFSGTQGSFGANDLQQAFDNNPPLSQQVRSVYLWGCYTTTMGALSQYWLGIFPNSNLAAGYDDRAPLGIRPVSANLLQSTLVSEARLTAARDRNELQRAFRGLDQVALANASVCINRDLVVSRRGVSSIRERLGECYSSVTGSAQNRALTGFNTYLCYMEARPNCPDVPADPGTSPLRDYYNYLHDTSICEQQMRDEHTYGGQRANREVVMRLIFDREVRRNFQNLYRNELAEMDRLLAAEHAPESLRFSNIGQMTRAQWIEKFNQFKSWLDHQNCQYGCTNANLLALRNMKYSLQEFSELEPASVPMSWIDPGATDRGTGFQNMIDAVRNGRTEALSNRYDQLDQQTIASGPGGQPLATTAAYRQSRLDFYRAELTRAQGANESAETIQIIQERIQAITNQGTN